MTITKNNILTSWLLAFVMGMVLMSCSSDSLPNITWPTTDKPKQAIAFASDLTEQEAVSRVGAGPATRATTLGHDFTVYGYKTVGGTEQIVFNGYTIRYSEGSAHTSTDNTDNYYYVEGGQSIKYWDFAASEYDFWGMWQEDERGAAFSETKKNVLTIPNVTLRIGDYPDAPVDDVLFSALYVRQPVSADVVQLQFKRPYAKLRIQFYTNDPIDDADYNIELSDISFAPNPDATLPLVNKVYGKGDVKVTYPLSDDACDGEGRESIEVLNLDKAQDALLFDAVTLTPTLGISSSTAVTAPIDDSQGLLLGDMSGVTLKAPATRGSTRAGEQPGRNYFYYPLPMGEKNPAFTMSVCIDGNAERKTAVVPAIYMQWKANYSYTYIFKITEAGKQIEFYDVKIDPWKYGGGGEDIWTNW